MSTLALPEPALAQGATARRAHQLFLSGRTHAAQEQWPHAAKAFAQAADLSRDTAYALNAAHASIKAARADDAVSRLRALRRVHPQLTLAYTLESHAWLDVGRADEAACVLQALPAQAARDHHYHVSLAVSLQRLKRHDGAVQAFLAALALKMDDALVALSHGHVVQGARPQGRGRRVRAHRAGAGARQRANWRRAAVAVPRARGLSMGSGRRRTRHLARRGAGGAGPRRDRDRCLRACGGGGRRAGAAQGGRAVRRSCRRTRVPLPRRPATAHDGRLRIGYLSADFHPHATSQLAVEMFEAHDRQPLRGHLSSAGPDDGTPLRQRMRAASEHCVELLGRACSRWRPRSARASIDILIERRAPRMAAAAR